MKQEQKDAIREQIVIHTERLKDPELSDLQREGITKIIEDHEKQLKKPTTKESSKEDILKEQIALHTKRLDQPELTDLERHGIKVLIADLKKQIPPKQESEKTESKNWLGF